MYKKYLKKSPNTNVKEVPVNIIDPTQPRDEPPSSRNDAVNFETAITATKFGWFNIILVLISIPAGSASVFETTTMSYVFPVAQCDLDLTLNEKGSLNAITFLGMVSSGFVWGFLCDTLGRKKLLVAGYLLDGFFVTLSAFSQNFTLLIIAKFFGGLIINGPFSALAVYISEFHCAKYRTRVQLGRGIIVSCGTMMLPLLAWAILPQNINLSLFNNKIVIHSWNVYLFICAIPSLLSGVVFIFMPESPKFLMTVGRNEEALAVFKKVYRLNTGNNPEMFPIKELVDETQVERSNHGGRVTANRTKRQALKEGFQQIKPLCFPPHVKHIVLICCIQSFNMLSVNTLRLWLPQIFQAISDYKFYHNGTGSSLCDMLGTLRPQNVSNNTTCEVIISSSVYFNTMIIATVAISGFLVTAFLVNKLGKKIILYCASIIGGICSLSIYFAQDTNTTLALSSIFLAMGQIFGNVLISVNIELFPTTLRTITISLMMMMGRSTSMIGNLIFPLLLKIGCAPPFFFIGTGVLVCTILTFFLPNTDLKPLE